MHILHGDDWVAPGFYMEIEMLFCKHPEAGAAFTNNFNFLQEEEEIRARSPLANQAGVLQDALLMIAERQEISTPSVVVKRIVYEQLGGFFAVHYGEDWEMWARIAAHFPIAYSPRCLAYYRYLNRTSISYSSIKNGQNITDIMQIIDIMQQYLPVEQRERLKMMAQRNYSRYCASLAHTIYEQEADYDAAFVQTSGALHMSKDLKVLYLVLKLYVKHIIGYKQLKKLWQ
ncbi:hypothetical protein ACFQT0_31385 [Hymenobacter humi]|uniref:Uncharacterized protein n=1 Tax=Hymenobacter humi TaxID=1411620 RepID=A0ABW2UEG4_9BACT